jgi:hypothetical protein
MGAKPTRLVILTHDGRSMEKRGRSREHSLVYMAKKKSVMWGAMEKSYGTYGPTGV